MRLYDAINGILRTARATAQGQMEVAVRGANIQHAHAHTPGSGELPGVPTYGPATMVWLGGEGDVTITLVDGSSLPIPGVPAGSWTALPQFTHLTASTGTGILVGY